MRKTRTAAKMCLYRVGIGSVQCIAVADTMFDRGSKNSNCWESYKTDSFSQGMTLSHSLIAMTQQIKIGLINGSTRSASNTKAIISGVAQLVNTSFPNIHLDIVHLVESPGHPLPYIIEDVIPAAQSLESLPLAYYHPDVRTWSAQVQTWDALLIVTPQYNWGIPGILKNSIDHLYHEWKNTPAGIITIGGHGGGKCAESLKLVLGGGCKMDMCDSPVAITLPKNVIGTLDRLDDGKLVEEKKEDVQRVVQELLAKVEKRRN